MKNIMILALVCSCFGAAISQPTPAKGDDIIVITSENQPVDVFKSIMKKLAYDGVAVEKSDSEVLTIETSWQDYKYGHVRFTVFVADMGAKATVRIRGEVNINNLGKSKIEYRGMKKSFIMLAWEDMENFAQKLDMGQLQYTKS